MEKPIWRLRASTLCRGFAVHAPARRRSRASERHDRARLLHSRVARIRRHFPADRRRARRARPPIPIRGGFDPSRAAGGHAAGRRGSAACALRELAEETGYQAERCELVAEYFPEPVRSQRARTFTLLAMLALAGAPQPDPTEHHRGRGRLAGSLSRDAARRTIDTGGSVAGGYLALERLGTPVKPAASPAVR